MDITLTPNLDGGKSFSLSCIGPSEILNNLVTLGQSISQSKIGLNLSQGKSSNYYSSDRFSQLIGNGLLVMIDEKTNIGKFFEKNEIITYKNVSDLSEKIIKYSNDNYTRSRIAKKGRDKYFKYFNSTLVAEFIIHKTFGLNKKKYYWEI